MRYANVVMTTGPKLLRILCAAQAVEPEAPVKATLDGVDYAVFVVDGRFYVTQDQCTHGPGSLADGFVLDGEIECPFHQGRFDIATGRPTAPPCTEALRIWTAEVRDGSVCIDPAEDQRNA